MPRVGVSVGRRQLGRRIGERSLRNEDKVTWTFLKIQSRTTKGRKFHRLNEGN